MTFPFTGVAHLLLTIALGLLSYRFFQYWQKKKDTTSKCIFFFTLCLSLYAFVRGITCLLFVNNTEILIQSTFFSAFIQGLAAAVTAYLIIHLKFPKISPWLGFIIIFILGIISLALSIILRPSNPFSEESGAINWGYFLLGDYPLFYYLIFRLVILLIAFIPLIVIMWQQFITSKDADTKIKAFGLSTVLFLGVVIGLLDFLLMHILGFSAVNRDIVAMILSVFIFFIVFVTQKPPQKEYE